MQASEPPISRDTSLVQQTLSGSREAFGLLVVRYSRTVRATCLARLGTHQDIEDMVQESFLRAFRGLDKLQDGDRFGAYVHRIARNVCIDRLRGRHKDARSLQEVDLVPTESPQSDVHDEREELLASLRHQVGQLPRALREAVLLFYFERMSHARIAETLEITEAAVNQRLHRARVQLRQSVGRAMNRSRDPLDEGHS